jgi:hypothetical protein
LSPGEKCQSKKGMVEMSFAVTSRHSQGDSKVTGGVVADAALQRNATAIVNAGARIIAPVQPPGTFR